MHPYLARLGVLHEVQAFFDEHYDTLPNGDLGFDFGDGLEIYGFAYHRLPVSKSCWTAGNLSLGQVRQVFISFSALEAVAWLNKKYAFIKRERLLFIALGRRVGAAHIRYIREHLAGRDINFLVGRDLAGQVTALKLAAAIRRQPLQVHLLAEENVQVTFRGQTFVFGAADFSLTAFERAAGFRFDMPALRPRQYNSFLDELLASAGLTK